jgi:hypothetical protein
MALPGIDLYPDGLPAAAERVYTRCLPITDGDEVAGFPLFMLADVLTAGSQALEHVVREDGAWPAWARVVDADAAPLWALPWLASLVGVEWNGEPTEALRVLIKERPRWKRGTPKAARAAARATMSMTATDADVRVLARAGGPWDDTIVITASKAPDQTATTAALLEEKPAGRRWTIAYTDEPTIDEMARTIDAITAQIDNLTLADVT